MGKLFFVKLQQAIIRIQEKPPHRDLNSPEVWIIWSNESTKVKNLDEISVKSFET